MFRNLLVAVVTILVATKAPALEPLTQEHKSQKGYTLKYPAGWKVVNPPATELPKHSGECPDFDLFLTKGKGSGSADLNVVVLDGEMPMNEDAKALLRQLPQTLSKQQGIRVLKYQLREESVGDLAGYAARFDAASSSGTVTVFQFYTAKGGKTFIFSTAAPQDEFRGLEPTFRMMVASLEVSNNAASPELEMVAASPKEPRDPQLKYLIFSLTIMLVMYIAHLLGILKS